MPRSTLRLALCAGVLCLAAGAPAAFAQAPTTTTIKTKRLNIRVGHRATVVGTTAPPAAASAATPTPSAAALQIRRRGRWGTLDRARPDSAGRYVLRARVRRPMSAPARVRLTGGETRRLGRLNVYRAALASWYGPGFFGGRTACGGTLTVGRLGVAHRTLPCGARVALRHGGRTIRVRVIDRGPYAGGREFDLTAATARALGFHGVGTILVAR